MEQMGTEVSADDGAAEERVVDADGVEVDALTIDWLVFIALHTEADRSFTDDELLIDLLLMLGYRDGEKLRTLAQDALYRTAFRDATVRLGLDGAGLLRRVIVEGDQDLHYELTEKRVQDIRAVADAIGGTVWGDAGTDEIDTYSEVAWLATMALRLEDGSTFLGRHLPIGDRHLLTRDELLKVLDSMWRHGDRETTLRELGLALAKLEDAKYVEQKKPFRGEEGWTLTSKAWGGVYKLRDNLQTDVKDQIPPIEETPQDPQATRHEQDVSTTNDLALADSVPQDGQRDNVDEQFDGSAESESADTEDDVSQSAGAVPTARSAPSGYGKESRQSSVGATESSGSPIVSDLDLCVAVLQTLPRDPDREDHPLEEGQIVDLVAERLNLSHDYMISPIPPWADRGSWAAMVRRSGREPRLLAYRIEHVFRALSIEQVGLIRDVAITDKGEGRWALTAEGSVVARSTRLDQPDGLREIAEKEYHGIRRYFEMHSYANWHDVQESEQWISDIVEHLNFPDEPDRRRASRLGGAAFELLVAALMEKMQLGLVEPQRANDYLDRAGVDLVVEDLAGDPVHRRITMLLVQCKRFFTGEIPSDAASKLFATTAWLKAQFRRDSSSQRVSGARLVFLGDLSREATWTFWALKAAWDVMEREGRPATARGRDAGPDEQQPELVWDIWDGQKVVRLMREYAVGVKVDSDEVPQVDEKFFAELRERVEEEAEPRTT